MRIDQMTADPFIGAVAEAPPAPTPAPTPPATPPTQDPFIGATAAEVSPPAPPAPAEPKPTPPAADPFIGATAQEIAPPAQPQSAAPAQSHIDLDETGHGIPTTPPPAPAQPVTPPAPGPANIFGMTAPTGQPVTPPTVAFNPSFQRLSGPARTAKDEAQRLRETQGRIDALTTEKRSGMWNTVDKQFPPETAYAAMRELPTEDNQKKFADSLVRSVYGNDPAKKIAEEDAQAGDVRSNTTGSFTTDLAGNTHYRTPQEVQKDLATAPSTDKYGNPATPQAKLAARMIVDAGGWDKMTPTNKAAFHHLMETAAGVQEQLHLPRQNDPARSDSTGSAFIQSAAQGASSIPGMDVPSILGGSDPLLDEEYQKNLADLAKKNPLSSKAGSFAGGALNPVNRIGGGLVGKALAPIIGETAGGLSALTSGSVGTLTKTVAQSAFENATFGGSLTLAQQVADGHINLDDVLAEAAKQGVLGPAFHFTVGAGMEGLHKLSSLRDAMPPAERTKFDSAIYDAVKKQRDAGVNQQPSEPVAQEPAPPAAVPTREIPNAVQEQKAEVVPVRQTPNGGGEVPEGNPQGGETAQPTPTEETPPQAGERAVAGEPAEVAPQTPAPASPQPVSGDVAPNADVAPDNPQPAPGGQPDWVRERLIAEGKNPDRMLNEIDAARPKTGEQLANDPLMSWLKKNNPPMADRLQRGDLSAKEYSQLLKESQPAPSGAVVPEGNVKTETPATPVVSKTETAAAPPTTYTRAQLEAMTTTENGTPSVKGAKKIVDIGKALGVVKGSLKTRIEGILAAQEVARPVAPPVDSEAGNLTGKPTGASDLTGQPDPRNVVPPDAESKPMPIPAEEKAPSDSLLSDPSYKLKPGQNETPELAQMRTRIERLRAAADAADASEKDWGKTTGGRYRKLADQLMDEYFSKGGREPDRTDIAEDGSEANASLPAKDAESEGRVEGVAPLNSSLVSRAPEDAVPAPDNTPSVGRKGEEVGKPVEDGVNNAPHDPQKRTAESAPTQTPGGEAMYSGLPLGLKPNGSPMSLRDLYHRARDFFSIDALPTVRRKSQDAANKLAGHASAPLAVTPEARSLMSRILPERYKDSDFTTKTMDLLNKNDILGGYDERRTQAKEERAKGNDDAAERLDAMADDIAKAHDLKAMDDEVKAGIADPEIKKAFENWRDIYGKESEAYYRRLKQLGSTDPLESRGRYLGTRVNLKPVTDESPAGEVAPGSGGAGNLRNPSVKRDKFDRMAKLTGEYDTDMQSVLENSLGQRMNETTKLDAYDALAKAGLASLRDPGSKAPKEGWQRIEGANVPGPGGTRVAKDLWVEPDSFRQVRDALNLSLKEKPLPIASAINMAQLKGIIDPLVHSRNLVSAVAQSQGGKTIIGDFAKKFPGVNYEEAIRSIAQKHAEVVADTPAVRDKIAMLAKNAMLRGDVEDAGATHKVIQAVDTASRLVLNDRFDDLAQRGLKKDTLQNRRDFVNQAGQYNRRLMGPVMRTLKDWGISPFVVAGRNFNRQAVRAVTGGSPGSAPDLKSALQTRLTNVLTATLGTAVAAATTNYLLYGSMTGKAGVPVGGIYLGTDDDKGNPKYIDLLQFNLVRRGLAVTGLGSIIDGLGRGESWKRMAGNAATSITNSQLHPLAGPAAKFATTVTTGAEPQVPFKQISPDVPGDGINNWGRRITKAAENVNPLLASGMREIDSRIRGTPTESTPDQPGILDTLKKQVAGIAGIKSGRNPGSEAMQIARDLRFHPGNTADFTPEMKAKYELKNKLADAYRDNKDSAGISKAYHAGQITVADAKDIATRAKMTPLQYAIHTLSPDNAIKVYDAATKDEKQELHDAIRLKIGISRQSNEAKQTLLSKLQ